MSIKIQGESNLPSASTLVPPSTTKPVTNAVASTLPKQPDIQSKLAEEKDPLKYLQQIFALLNMDGKLSLVDLTSIDRRTSQGVASKLCLSNMHDGELLIRRALKAKFPSTDANSIVRQFWISPETVCCSGVEFNPAGTSDHYLNLWVGPTIKPKHGEWPLISAFLLEVLCAGDRKVYQYVLGYIAHALQRPWEKPGVMIAMISGQGTGKGTLARILRKIWSATFLHVHNIDAVTGNFNASLERAFIVFMDEALFSGDRRASDALKSLVTEPVISINEKHQPARQTGSYHRFFAATNAEHFKNTERDDRRDLVLRLSESRKGNHEYWIALNAEIDGNGVEAMVHDLLAMDISGFNVRDKPNTKELLEQKLQSLGPVPRWWHDRLYRGCLDNEEVRESFESMDFAHEYSGWPEFISTLEAIQGVIDVSGGRLYKKPSALDMARAIKELCSSAKPVQVTINSNRKRGFSLPTLAQARAEFEAYIGSEVNWPEDAE
jgi:hypothetical protein